VRRKFKRFWGLVFPILFTFGPVTAWNFVDTKPLWLKLLQAMGLPEEAYYQGYHLEGKSALRHLVRVASSLESLVIGEPQILGQLKEAVQWTKENRFPLDPSLDRTFQLAFEAAKRVRTETKIAEKPVSVASLGLRYFESEESQLAAEKVVVVGRGPISQAVAQWFTKNRPTVPILWVNRHVEHLKNLAPSISERIQIQSLADFLQTPPSFSHLFSATSSIEPVFGRAFLESLSKPALLFDFGEPPDITKIDSCHVQIVQLEDLRGEAQKNGLERVAEVRDAEKLIEIALKEYILAQKEAPILKEFSRVEDGLTQILEETYLMIEQEFPNTLHNNLKKMAERLVKKNLHCSREHLRTILREMTSTDPRHAESPL
jgi:glutamyl-tRNA reductase